MSAARPPRPRALTASAAFGAVGVVLLLAGLVTGIEALMLLAGAAGTLSLISALVWRSQLVEAWHSQRKRGDLG